MMIVVHGDSTNSMVMVIMEYKGQYDCTISPKATFGFHPYFVAIKAQLRNDHSYHVCHFETGWKCRNVGNVQKMKIFSQPRPPLIYGDYYTKLRGRTLTKCNIYFYSPFTINATRQPLFVLGKLGNSTFILF